MIARRHSAPEGRGRHLLSSRENIAPNGVIGQRPRFGFRPAERPCEAFPLVLRIPGIDNLHGFRKVNFTALSSRTPSSAPRTQEPCPDFCLHDAGY